MSRIFSQSFKSIAVKFWERERFLTSGRGQNFERRNVERLKFRNFRVANIKITKDEFFDSFIIVFFHFLNII